MPEELAFWLVDLRTEQQQAGQEAKGQLTTVAAGGASCKRSREGSMLPFGAPVGKDERRMEQARELVHVGASVERGAHHHEVGQARLLPCRLQNGGGALAAPHQSVGVALGERLEHVVLLVAKGTGATIGGEMGE